MLTFERRLAAAITAHLDPAEQDRVLEFVARSLRTMPLHLRAPIVCVSLLLDARSRITLGASARERAELTSFEDSRLNPVRQYARLMRSLALFAEYEFEQEESE